MPEELDATIAAARHYAVISPNLLEMQTILSIPPSDPTQADVAHAAKLFRDRLAGRSAIIVRAGEMGSYTLSDGWTGWVPAFWRAHEQDRVVDVTGGGNAFLGGLMAGLLLSDGDFRIGE